MAKIYTDEELDLEIKKARLEFERFILSGGQSEEVQLLQKSIQTLRQHLQEKLDMKKGLNVVSD